MQLMLKKIFTKIKLKGFEYTRRLPQKNGIQKMIHNKTYSKMKNDEKKAKTHKKRKQKLWHIKLWLNSFTICSFVGNTYWYNIKG